MKRKRLLVVSNNYDLAGAPIALFNLIVSLQERFEFLVVSQRDGPLRERFLDHGVEALVVVNSLQNAEVSAAMLLSHDGLIANTLPAYASVHAAELMRKPSLWIIHEGLAWQRFLKDSAPGSTQALAMATIIGVPCQFARRLYLPWRQKRTEVVPWGVDVPESPAIPASDLAAGEKETSLGVLLVGSFQHRKGQDIALGAMQLLDEKRFNLEMIGKIENQEFFTNVMTQYGDVAQARYSGEVTMERAAAMIGECDILIVPSRDELTPLVILDAMAAGKVVIAADVGGVSEMFDDGQSGLLVPPDDPADMARALGRVGRDAGLRRRIGAAAREFVSSRRTRRQCSDHYARIITELLDTPVESPPAESGAQHPGPSTIGPKDPGPSAERA